MQRSRSKTPKRSVKRSRTSRSTSRAPRRALFPRRALALAAPSVGLGTSATTVLRTSFFANVSGSGSAIYTGFLKPGSCFDPAGDVAAVQPQMFDQFSAMYSRYKVNTATVRMKIIGASGGAGCITWVACIYPAVDSTALATYQAAASQQYAKTTSGGFQVVTPPAATGYVGTGNEGKYLSIRMNHNSIVGAKSDTWDIGAPVTADPTAGQFMVLPIFIQGNSNSSGATWTLEVDIWQNVTFSQKKNTVDA